MSTWNTITAVASHTHIHRALQHVHYKNWTFVVHGTNPDLYLQVEFDAEDHDQPAVLTRQRGRKWRLSQHMTRSEIVQTALAAVLAAVEHEARECFLYRGEAVFGPHHDVDALLGVGRDYRP